MEPAQPVPGVADQPSTRTRRRRGAAVFAPALVLAMSLMAAACAPPPSGTDRYVDRVFATTSATTNLVYATAPDLITSEPVALLADVFQPVGDTLAARPAVIWVHGGGFKAGTKASTAEVAQAYAQRGYVTLSINYRLDTGNECQAVQDGEFTDPVQEAAERARCTVAILAAQHDTQAAVRWLRANAATYGVDPDRIAVGGFSAGAVTAVNVAQNAEDPGDVGENDGVDSSVDAALVASGCNYAPESIDAADAPMFLLASELDQAVPFECVRATELRTRTVGVPVETMYFMGEGTHAADLYRKYRTQVDAGWTSFLVDHLDLA